ncbi:MAG TPA: alkaline phosphatase family protein [Acidimicrobiales bacterium]|jgi:phospholipase C|nr:alkaline phosphatase family protein [Acidimicrobiales bacterium]
MTGSHPNIGRRTILKAGLAAAAGVMAPLGAEGLMGAAGAAPRPASPLRTPNSRPYPALPAGLFTGAFYFDHIVIVMQENHSFDNYLGMLPVSGQPRADGFEFNRREEPVDWTPVGNDRMYAYHQAGADGASNTGSQSWNDSHLQINNGAMDGFARTGPGSMGYYTEDDLPFYYSLAKTFTLANRWFCSVPAQTYPNRRFLMAGTASGLVSTDIGNIGVRPANGTIWDRLSTHGIDWKNYFTDLPTSAIIDYTVTSHPTNYARIEEFYADAAAGTLPSVSLVDCDYGAVTGQIGGQLPPPTFGTEATIIDTTAESEENPQNVQLGEAFVARVVNAVMSGPAWRRTLLVWTYDEHGGYYDHVAPPAALAPDDIAPDITASDQPGTYRLLGPRVPAVVVSPYARRHEVTNVVHDHTSVLATIEQQWNLPALTWRDANARTIVDFLDQSHMTFAEPPELARPANPVPGLVKGYQGQPAPPAPSSTGPR